EPAPSGRLRAGHAADHRVRHDPADGGRRGDRRVRGLPAAPGTRQPGRRRGSARCGPRLGRCLHRGPARGPAPPGGGLRACRGARLPTRLRGRRPLPRDPDLRRGRPRRTIRDREPPRAARPAVGRAGLVVGPCGRGEQHGRRDRAGV
ncbi:MAG: hypothetical protein AVDCRST_MAG32-1528, partial [uncultured Nocardioides sp.]